MKQMKQKHWQVSVFDKTSEIIKDDTFYTTDTEAYLVFELIDEDFIPDSAMVTVYNIYGTALINVSVEVADGIVRYEMPKKAIRHRGGWRTQVIFTKDGEDYTTKIIEFDVGGHLLDSKKPPIIEIENWNSFIAHAGELIDDWEQLEEIRQANEQQRELAESARQTTFETNESTRQSEFETNETSRQANELVREEAENNRQSTFETNETERQNEFEANEGERESTFEINESARQTSELVREEAESNRQSTFEENELARKSAESERVANEAERISKDGERDSKIEVVEGRQDSVESQWQAMSDEMTDKDVISAPEIIAARNGEANLKSRLDKENAEVKTQLAENAKYIDKNSPSLINQKISNLLRQSNNGLANVTYIMVGDSTRASNGAYIYNMVKPVMESLKVIPYLSAQSGLKAEHWGASDDIMQPGYPQASDLIELIPDTGMTTIIDICLGLNDASHTISEIKSYIKAGIDLIKAAKPNVLINLTSPNIWNSANDYKLSIVYKELTTENSYGYINVHDNVFKAWADTDGYFIDEGHPNELGQKKMGEYILSKLIPEDLRLSYFSNIPVPLGGLVDVSINDVIKKSGIRCEVIYTTGTPTGNLYLRKLNDGKWYFYDVTSGNALSKAIVMKNGKQILLEGGYVTDRKIKALITIDDYGILDNILPAAIYYPIENAIVTKFTKNKTYGKSIFDLTVDMYSNNNQKILKGSISKNDIHYNELKDAGLRIEIHQTSGIPYENLYIRKAGDGHWYIYSDTISTAFVSKRIDLIGWNTITKNVAETREFEGEIYIEDVTILNNFTNTTVFILLENVLVTEISQPKTLFEHINYLYDMIN